MSISLAGTDAMVLDIEGTTTPIDFVYGVLFPFVRAHVGPFLAEHLDTAELAADIERLAADHAAESSPSEAPPAWPAAGGSRAQRVAAVAAYVEWLMDRDRKSRGLKSLQGKVWERGYRDGQLRGQVFPDVPPALARWHRGGRAAYVYSSGSVLAQRLLLSTCPEGDLTRYLRGYFDTTIGPKRSVESYRAIAAAIAVPPARIRFVSDVTEELEAAADAALGTVLSVRPGNPPQPAGRGHASIATFDELID